jgi:sialic acid synthase SpsE
MIENYFEKNISIGNKNVGPGFPCFIIAEAGSNHNGNFEQAIKLIDIAKNAGCDAVKFQTFTANKMYVQNFNPASYLIEMGINKSVYDIIQEMEMPLEWIPKLYEYCKLKDIIFLSTPFDEKSADILDPYVDAFKIASYEMTHAPLINHIAKKNKPMLISTGAATIDEIDEMLELLSITNNKKLCLFQCTAKYPAPLNSLNLNVLELFQTKFNIPVGLSDHSLNQFIAPLISIGKGVNIIEKHFTISKHLPGPDHVYALEPMELNEMVSFIRDAELTLGNGEKMPHLVEAELRNYRRSIFTTQSINKGDILSKDNLSILRRSGDCESDLKPRDFDCIIGSYSTRDLPINFILNKSDCSYEF